MSLFKETFEPMLLTEEKEIFNSKDYIYEIKFDGMRALLFVSPKTFKILNRHKREITYLFPELENIKKLVTKPTIFDGEIVSFQNKVPSFQKLQKRIHLKGKEKIKSARENNPIIFICFDILFEGSDLTKKPLLKRKEILEKYQDTDEFIKTIYQQEQGKLLFQKIKELNLEGVVAKEIHSTYEKNTRSNSWIKIKNLKTDTFLIGGYEEKKSTSMFSVLLGTLKNNELIFVGKVSVPRKSGLLSILKKEKKLKKSSFKNYEEENVNFINPKYMCYVEYLEKSKDGILRHPVYKGFLE